MPIHLENFRENLIYETTAPVANIVKDLNEIAEIDKTAQAKQKQFTILLWCFIPVAVLSFFLISSVGTWGAIIFVLSLIATIYIWMMAIKYERLNIANHRYELLEKVLQMLERDMNSASDVIVRLSFNPVQERNNQTETIPHPYKTGWKIRSYQLEWLKISGQFLDKTKFTLNITELSKKQDGTKRGRSGKIKSKSKTKSQGLDVDLTLNYPQRRYGAIKILNNEAIEAVKIPEFSQIRRLIVTDKEISLKVRTAPGELNNKNEIYQTIAMMFLSLYQILNLANILSKRKEK